MKTPCQSAQRQFAALLISGLLLMILTGLAAADAPASGKSTGIKGTPPFTGTVQKVDRTASTITLNGKDGGRVFYVTPQTKITKAGQPATLADAKVGEEAAGVFRDVDGKRTAISLRLGPKLEKSPAKK